MDEEKNLETEEKEYYEFLLSLNDYFKSQRPVLKSPDVEALIKVKKIDNAEFDRTDYEAKLNNAYNLITMSFISEYLANNNITIEDIKNMSEEQRNAIVLKIQDSQEFIESYRTFEKVLVLKESQVKQRQERSANAKDDYTQQMTTELNNVNREINELTHKKLITLNIFKLIGFAIKRRRRLKFLNFRAQELDMKLREKKSYAEEISETMKDDQEELKNLESSFENMSDVEFDEVWKYSGGEFEDDVDSTYNGVVDNQEEQTATASMETSENHLTEEVEDKTQENNDSEEYEEDKSEINYE